MGAPRPTPAAIRRTIEGMRAAGLPVEGCRVLRDGSVIILASVDAAPIPSTESEVDAWDKATGS
ncbi:hypothetical protein BDD41_3098 [Paracoccus versutus]|uniref:Uncharacterized protein n=1 Tax=Paracoccus versutus TaxID=34007 RepID=A0A3D9XIQ0_PARVE|nr:hypothetical protein BDD41_3098 [Paracoccus versutus]